MNSYVTMPLGDFFRDVYLPQKLRITSPSTIKHYDLCIRALGEAVGRIATLGDLTDGNIAAVLRAYAAKGLSPHTIEQRRSYLVALVNWASRRQMLPWCTSLGEYPTPTPQPRAWTLLQMEMLLAACKRTTGDYHGVPCPLWWRAFHGVLWDTGERTSAVLFCEWNHLDESSGSLRVPPHNRKGGRKGEVYYLKRGTLLLLDKIKQPVRERIFPMPGKRDCQGTFYYHYSKLLRLAGLPDTRYDKPQRIRRTFASFVEKAGGDATKALGHSSRRVTLEHYLDQTIIDAPAPNLLLPPLEDPTT